MARVPIHNVGVLGVVTDRPPHTLPPEAWTDARNMRFVNRQAERIKGHSEALGTPSVVPGFILNVPDASNSFWIYGDTETVWVNDGGTHTEITRDSGDYTAANLWDWSYCFIGGIAVLNNRADVPQYWPTASAATKLVDLTGWDTYPVEGFRARVIRSFGRFLIALATSDNSGSYPHRLVWSSQAGVGSVPASWDVSDPTVDASQADLTDINSGDIRDGLILGNQFYIYKEAATHVMRYIGGSDIMAFDFLFSTGILATRCVCLIDKGRKHFVVTEDDVIVHSGVKDARSVVEEKVRERLFLEINQDARATCFCFDSAVTNEAWFCYPTTGSSVPNRAFIYDYKKETTSFRDWQGLDVGYGAITDAEVVAWDDLVGTWEDGISAPWNSLGGKALVIADPTADLFYHLEEGNQYGAATVTAFLERTGLAITGRDRQGEPKVDYATRKQINRVWSKITGTGAEHVQIQLGSQEEIDGPITWTLPQAFNPAVRYNDFDDEAGVTGRLNAIRFSSDVDEMWKCEGYDVEINPVGEN